MVPGDSDLMTTLELGGKRICALAGSTSPDNAKRYFTRHRMELQLQTYDSLDAAKQAYLEGKCDALTSDQSQLFSLRTTLQDPGAHRILGEVISKEPLGPAVRKGDARWFDIVRWTLFLLIDAEELGIDSANADRAREQAKAEETRLLLDADGATAGCWVWTPAGATASSSRWATIRRSSSAIWGHSPAQDQARPERLVARRWLALRAAGAVTRLKEIVPVPLIKPFTGLRPAPGGNRRGRAALRRDERAEARKMVEGRP